MKNSINKIRGLSTAISVISIIGRILIALALCFILAAGAFLVALPRDFVSADMGGNATFTIKGLPPLSEFLDSDTNEGVDVDIWSDEHGLHTALDVENVHFDLKELPIFLIAPAVRLIALFIVLCFVGALANELKKSHSPFVPSVISKLKAVGWSLIGWVVSSAAASWGVGMIIAAMHDISAVRFTININLESVLLVLFFLLLVYILNHGVALQNESDTTL